ncbi:hypothetical protein C7445_1163 [Alicyclobacillus sacchari]|uniref:Uncharacterized protein n=1 Tax=Alicyclobacillus sacchari TaxID=392010 RepID=A0A4R8LHS2_9BACL|nr:hypothetical protein C7445_1163 [Alicyclobacillus sacchari]
MSGSGAFVIGYWIDVLIVQGFGGGKGVVTFAQYFS